MNARDAIQLAITPALQDVKREEECVENIIGALISAGYVIVPMEPTEETNRIVRNSNARIRASVRHDLKIWLPYFDAILEGRKTFEVRKNDRDYKVGDWLRLLPYDPDKKKIARRFGVRHIDREITYMMEGGQFGLDPDYVVLAMR